MSGLPGSATARLVEERARGRCEYCGMYQALQGATFHVEHVQPTARGGTSEVENLAWCCPSCNLHKSDRTEAPDPGSGVVVALFHPRRDSWPDHFEWDGDRLVGKTPVGRATIRALDLNHPRRIRIRRAERTLGLGPDISADRNE